MLDTARLYHRAGKYEAAEDLYWQVMELDNSHPEPYHLLGMIALQARKLDPARQLMQTALELDPAEPIYHANMGTRHYQAGDYAAAETEYRRAVELDPEYAEAQFNLGILLKEHHRLRDAVEPLDEAARIQPAAKAFAPLAEVLIRLDHYEQADEVARAANQLGTQDRSGKGSLVRALQGLGRPRQALTWARELEAEAPDVAHYHQMLATTYMEAGFPNQAPDEARRAYQLDPQNPRNHPTLAQTADGGHGLGRGPRDQRQGPGACARGRRSAGPAGQHPGAKGADPGGLRGGPAPDQGPGPAPDRRPECVRQHRQVVRGGRGGRQASG
ncbi:tetratricopeptide repeat protein [Thiohalorhabdus sp.]|uniref:tetratricopeptide repeat protein n=1 Tax=Thiohalorhabdus sp. TaxID=3094134 RepID=UPI002FC3A1A4